MACNMLTREHSLIGADSDEAGHTGLQRKRICFLGKQWIYPSKA